MEYLLQESIAFISKNITTTTDQIPDHLLYYWAIPVEFNIYFRMDRKRPEFTVFMYALTKYYETEGKEEFSRTPTELINQFEDFQTIIGFAIADRDAQYPIFDFDNYNKLMKSI